MHIFELNQRDLEMAVERLSGFLDRCLCTKLPAVDVKSKVRYLLVAIKCYASKKLFLELILKL